MLLRKATGSVSHEGGPRFTVGSTEYRLLLDWITAGCRDDRPGLPKLTSLDVTPTGRILFSKVSEELKQQFVVENRGGAGGTIGEAVVAKADADGYTVLHDATAFSVNGSLYPHPGTLGFLDDDVSGRRRERFGSAAKKRRQAIAQSCERVTRE